MEKIINAKQAAKDTIASELKLEITRINKCISKAKKAGKNECIYTVDEKPNTLSQASEALLKRVGYKVVLMGVGVEVTDQLAAEGIYNIISWEKEYNKALKDKRNFKEFIGAAGDKTSEY